MANRVTEIGFTCKGTFPESGETSMGVKGKFNKAYFLLFLAYLVIFEKFPSSASTLKNHQICQKIGKKIEEKRRAQLSTNPFLEGTSETRVIGTRSVTNVYAIEFTHIGAASSIAHSHTGTNKVNMATCLNLKIFSRRDN